LVSCFSSCIGADTVWDAVEAMLEGMRRMKKDPKRKKVLYPVIELFEH
jgi:hypothetical protein